MNRATGRALSSSPWRRAPRLLAGAPLLAVVLGAVSMVVGLVAATPRLFSASVAVGALERQLDPLCQGSTVAPYTRSDVTHTLAPMAAAVSKRPDVFDEPRMATVARFRQGASVTPAVMAGGQELPIGLATRDGYADHVEVLAGTAGPGLLLPDTVAQAAGVSAGDDIVIERGDATPVTIPVTGVVRDLTSRPLDSFWCPMAPAVTSQAAFDEFPPPPLALADRDTFDRLLHDLELRVTFTTWEAPIHVDLSEPSEARLAADAVIGLQAELRDEHGVSTSSSLGFVADRGVAVHDAVLAGITPVIVLAIAAVVVLLIGAAMFWLARREGEARLLWSRGVAPSLIGVRAGLEMLPAVVVGVAIGWLLALVISIGLGPGRHLEDGAALASAGHAAVAAALALAIAGSVVGWRVRLAPLGLARQRLPLPVWPLLAVAAVWAWQRMSSLELPIPQGDELARPDWSGFAVPVAFLVTTIGLAIVVVRQGLRATGGWVARLPVPLHLAARRVAAASAALLVLVAVAGLAVGVVTYSSGLRRSVQATVNAKLLTWNGAATRAYAPLLEEVPDPLRGSSTLVRKVEATYENEDVEVLAIDTDTFDDAVAWEGSYADEPLTSLLDRLGQTDGERVPAIAVGAGPTAGTVVFPFGGAARADVSVVAAARAFPGMDTDVPLLVVRRDDIAGPLERIAPTLWSSADADDVRSAIEATGVRVVRMNTPAQALDTSVFLPVLWTFGFVEALGMVVGAIAVVALASYLGLAARRRALAAGLLGRMGPSTARQWAIAAVELAIFGATACAAGVALGWIAVRNLSGLVDAAPDMPPAALLRFPGGTVGVVLMTTITAVVAAASLSTWVARRTDLAPVLRDGR